MFAGTPPAPRPSAPPGQAASPGFSRLLLPSLSLCPAPGSFPLHQPRGFSCLSPRQPEVSHQPCWIRSSKAPEHGINPGARLGTQPSDQPWAGAPRPWHCLPSGTGDISHLCSSCKNILFPFSAPIVGTTATNDPFLSII